jgi:hypothetical protein
MKPRRIRCQRERVARKHAAQRGTPEGGGHGVVKGGCVGDQRGLDGWFVEAGWGGLSSGEGAEEREDCFGGGGVGEGYSSQTSREEREAARLRLRVWRLDWRFGGGALDFRREIKSGAGVLLLAGL